MACLSVFPSFPAMPVSLIQEKHILLYEDITLLGIVCGNLFFLYGWHIPGGTFTLLLYGLFSGIFLGGWIMALAEMADVFPIFSRRIKLTNGIRWVVIAVAFGKALGSLYYFYKSVVFPELRKKINAANFL